MTTARPRAGVEAEPLSRYRGRWVAQDAMEVPFDADRPEDVLLWLRRHGRSAPVWLVPSSGAGAGSTLSGSGV